MVTHMKLKLQVLRKGEYKTTRSQMIICALEFNIFASMMKIAFFQDYAIWKGK